MKFEESISKLKSSLQGLLNNESSTQFIESISSLDKQIDEVVVAHETTAKELQDTKESFVKYVKEVGFTKPSADSNPVEPQTPKSLDEIMKDSLIKIIKEEKK